MIQLCCIICNVSLSMILRYVNLRFIVINFFTEINFHDILSYLYIFSSK
jgi:hypothetical protein